MSSRKKRHRRRKSPFRIEAFLINYGLQVVGGLLITGALLYLVSINFNTDILAELLNSFIKSKSDKTSIPPTTVTSLSGYLSLLLFIPAMALLVLQHYLKKEPAWYKSLLVSLSFLWLIFSDGKILIDIRNHSIEVSYLLILISIGLVQLFSLAVAVAGKSRFTLSWAVIYFFVSAFLIRLIYGFIIPNLIALIVVQLTVSVSCFRFRWQSPFILLMTMSFIYLTYYFIKLVIIPGPVTAQLNFLMPALLIWFILSVTGFGILRPVTTKRISVFIWNLLPYATLVVALGLCLGFYYQSGIHLMYLLYYSVAVVAFVVLAIVNRHYKFIRSGDPFYTVALIFSAFLLPQLMYLNFFLFLVASLSVAFLANVLLTDLKSSFHLSMGLFFATLGLYLAEWIFTIIPAMVTQSDSGTEYPVQLLFGGTFVFALAYFYNRLFSQLLEEFAFSYAQAQKYRSTIRLVFYSITYLSGFLFTDYILILLIPGYRVNRIEWVLYSYLFVYFLVIVQNTKSRTRLSARVALSILALLLYPLVVHPEAIYFRTLYLAGVPGALLPFIMHYFCLGVMVFILYEVNKRIGMVYPRNRSIFNIRAITGILFLCFVLLAEYDHLMLLSFNHISSQSAYEMLQFNKFIPYSVILLAVSVALLIFSLIRYSKFLRRLSMLMILGVLIKVLFFDITILSSTGSIILLITLGAALLGFSFFIPRLRNQSKFRETSQNASNENLPKTSL